ncbi:hypothetical protein JQN63_14320 [Delftia lacustris]|nr:STY4528 family pathogenicity island replication protein [Delftia lacustris]QRI92979.1 hypothetical protein JQN63_14320 [Delftia lacustris]
MGDRYLYSGNRHETVPQALLLDRRLTPLERNAWQVFRLLLNDDGLTAFPTYDQLRPYLSSLPGAGPASHETVARALTLLRLTRWLSLVRRRRDARTGRINGNVYVLHDEALTPFEAMQLDAGYLELVSASLGHAAKSVQTVGLATLHDIVADPLLAGRALPSRLQVLAERLAAAEVYPQATGEGNSEDGEKSRLRMADAPASDSEPGWKASPANVLRIPKPTRTVRSSQIHKVRTDTPARDGELDALHWPVAFSGLKAQQQAGARLALLQVEQGLRQAVLDEWRDRCQSSGVRNPAAYLFGLIQRAIHGEFNAWRPSPPDPASRPARPEPVPAPRPASPEVARQHLARIRELLRKP